LNRKDILNRIDTAGIQNTINAIYQTQNFTPEIWFSGLTTAAKISGAIFND